MTLKYSISHNQHNKKEKWNLKNADWNAYQSKIGQNTKLLSWSITNNIEEDSTFFTNLILSTALDI